MVTSSWSMGQECHRVERLVNVKSVGAAIGKVGWFEMGMSAQMSSSLRDRGPSQIAPVSPCSATHLLPPSDVPLHPAAVQTATMHLMRSSQH
ncbi:hypothetical protein TNCV_4447581 [Trichonephila clavipes]|nr:hypothetical protein TNCV_4447581 [Trichonephila clavipes]